MWAKMAQCDIGDDVSNLTETPTGTIWKALVDRISILKRLAKVESCTLLARLLT